MILPAAMVGRLAGLVRTFGAQDADELIGRAIHFLDTVATVRAEGGTVAVRFRDGSAVEFAP